jgi:hypothetical protein
MACRCDSFNDLEKGCFQSPAIQHLFYSADIQYFQFFFAFDESYKNNFALSFGS